MNKFKNFILINILLFLMSCGTVKNAFMNQKKNNTDEFMVRKKDPLVMPPNFNDLPKPQALINEDNSDEENVNFPEVLDNKNIKKEKIKKSKGTLEKSISNILSNK